jgi:hypothetical protein
MSFALKPSVGPSMDPDQAALGSQAGRAPFAPGDDPTTFTARLNLPAGRAAADPQRSMGNELQLADLRAWFNALEKQNPVLLQRELKERGYKSLRHFEDCNPVLDPNIFKPVNLKGA